MLPIRRLRLAWYNAGTVAVTNNSANVTGTGTVWTDNAGASEKSIGIGNVIR